MPDDLIFPVPDDFQGRAWIDHSTYRHEYARSLADPEASGPSKPSASNGIRRRPRSFATARKP